MVSGEGTRKLRPEMLVSRFAKVHTQGFSGMCFRALGLVPVWDFSTRPTSGTLMGTRG